MEEVQFCASQSLKEDNMYRPSLISTNMLEYVIFIVKRPISL